MTAGGHGIRHGGPILWACLRSAYEHSRERFIRFVKSAPELVIVGHALAVGGRPQSRQQRAALLSCKLRRLHLCLILGLQQLLGLAVFAHRHDHEANPPGVQRGRSGEGVPGEVLQVYLADMRRFFSSSVQRPNRGQHAAVRGRRGGPYLSPSARTCSRHSAGRSGPPRQVTARPRRRCTGTRSSRPLSSLGGHRGAGSSQDGEAGRGSRHQRTPLTKVVGHTPRM